MLWSDICIAYPNQWVLVEALEAHTTADRDRHLDRLAVIERCPDGRTALQRYRALHEQYPEREFYYLHTSRQTLTIQEHQWFGIRMRDANSTSR